MKILLLSVALLFFTGAQGRYFWQQDAPAEKDPDVDVITQVVLEGLEMVSDVFERLDFEGIANEYHLKEKLDAARKHTNNFEKAVDDYFDKLWEQFDQKLDEKFPIFRKNVMPILKEFDDALEDQLEKIAEQIVPHATNLLSGMAKSLGSFIDNLEKVAEKGSDSLRGEIESLRNKLQPYMDEVHVEYERYRKDVHGEFQKDYSDIRTKVEKKMEEIKEHAKPHIENIRKNFPDRGDVQEKFEKLLKEFKEYVSKSD
ncbi:uncharacterized protein [Engystomops pustulosus]|uniref:uncharacterized protein n=1 Tax=Engystomops pustulosus TaxID=76066 RepID=UPI003AFB16AA